MEPGAIVLVAVVFVISISVHESAHAYEAWRRGDSTAKRQGRISLNPLDHVDLMGTIIVPGVMILFGLPPFGWAKPVPVNPMNLRDGRRDRAFVAGAGPGANFLLAGISVVLCILLAPLLVRVEIPLMEPLAIFLLANTTINVILGVFNLIPVPPLDGSGVLQYFLSPGAARWLEVNQRWLFLGLLVILFFPLTRGLLGAIFQNFIYGSYMIMYFFISLLWDQTVAYELFSLSLF